MDIRGAHDPRFPVPPAIFDVLMMHLAASDGLRSIRSVAETYIVFKNDTDMRVTVNWVSEGRVRG